MYINTLRFLGLFSFHWVKYVICCAGASLIASRFKTLLSSPAPELIQRCSPLGRRTPLAAVLFVIYESSLSQQLYAFLRGAISGFVVLSIFQRDKQEGSGCVRKTPAAAYSVKAPRRKDSDASQSKFVFVKGLLVLESWDSVFRCVWRS